MTAFRINKAGGLKGVVRPLGDKSIAHRSIIISAITRGKTVIRNFPSNQDCLSTLSAFKKLGIKIKPELSGGVTVHGNGLRGLSKPRGPIFVGESGTTLRLLLGVLAGQDFPVKLVAGKSLSRRPMLRVNAPLRIMGAKISSELKTQSSKREEYPPITIRGGNLKAITYKMPVASAQVKSALLLAGLYARGFTKIIEPLATRDHTERLLRLFKADIRAQKNNIAVRGGRELSSPGKIAIPADISSATFFLVAAAITARSRLVIKNVSLNPSRTGILRVLRRMGADMTVQNSKLKAQSFEPTGDIIVRSSRLKGTTVGKKEIPSVIDELPVLMVAACLAKGRTRLEGVSELRIKETDRIKSMSENLSKMGAKIQTVKAGKTEDIIIEGVKLLKGAKVRSFGDHRTAMSMAVAGLTAEGTTSIDDSECIRKSFPNFLTVLKKLLL
ncbi:MAG: 3-phosphoshikimate 1-carboxyvinyltransferase [Deltaproteobacteria bacterium]